MILWKDDAQLAMPIEIAVVYRPLCTRSEAKQGADAWYAVEDVITSNGSSTVG